MSDRNIFADQCSLLSGRQVQSIFDVGANRGDTTARYHATFPQATIHCFEPFPHEFDKLTERFKNDARVVPVRTAISNEIGQTCFYINRNSATNSLLPAAAESEYWSDSPHDVENVRQVKVPVTTIDAYCKQNRIELIDILKVDVQGTEQLLLEGAAQQLRRNSIALIQTEMQVVPVYEGQVFYYDLAGFLSRYGYTLFGIYNIAYAVNGQAKWCDAIFVSPSVRARYVETTEGRREPSQSNAAQRQPFSLRTDLQACRQDLARLRKENQRLEAMWRAMENSAGWRLLNRWRTLREQLAPQDSLRRRLYDLLIGKLRNTTTD